MAFNPSLSRRKFMVGCSAAIAAMAGSRITQLALASPEGPDANTYETVVSVFLRGGLDGINAVVPLAGADRAEYEAKRQDLRVPVAGVSGQYLGAGDLSVGSLGGVPFGLHPGLAPLHRLFNQNALAIVHAAGLVNDTRSHFDAMQFMETATPGVKTTGTGWLTRHLQTSPNLPTDIYIPALSAGSSPAMALMGREDLVTMNGANGFDIGEPWDNTSRDDRRVVLRQMYTGDNWLHTAGSKTLNAFDVIDSALSDYTPHPSAGYVPYNGFSDQLKTIAQIVKANLGLRAATIDLGGWDTHESQQNGNGDPRGYFLNALDNLSRGLEAFYNDLAGTNHASRVTVVVMSEFGRRFAENNNRGTDHGHGNVMFVIGGSVNKGLYGTWPGLRAGQLYDNADLAITTDYRTVLAEILTKRTGNTNVQSVFPGLVNPSYLNIVR
jgi:uncharacterized protein (DUF1501 family)